MSNNFSEQCLNSKINLIVKIIERVGEPIYKREICDILDRDDNYISPILTEAVKRGIIHRCGHGVYFIQGMEPISRSKKLRLSRLQDFVKDKFLKINGMCYE
jgi:hypothetical protein